MIHLVEAVAKRSTGKYGFPEKLNLFKLYQFILSKGFKEAEGEYTWPDSPNFTNEVGRVCYLGNNEGLQFMVLKDEKGKRFIIEETDLLDFGFYESPERNGRQWINLHTYEEFSNRVKDYFGWS